MERQAAVVTASDGVAHGARQDESGDAVAALLERAGFTVVERATVPDERTQIAATLTRLADETGVALVAVTGGTGFGPRDVTPEATRDVLDREAPGLGEAMRAVGRASTPMADLSRGIAGLRGSTLIVDLPGSPRGATESLEAVLPLLPHAIQLAGGDTQQHPPGHGQDGEATTSARMAAVEDHRPAHHDDTHHDHTHHDHGGHAHDEACALAHQESVDRTGATLVAVYASPVARHLLHWGLELGYRTVLVDPDPDRATAAHRASADEVVASVAEAGIDADTDVVFTDHDRDELGDLLADVLGTDARYVGLMGSRRHVAPHVGPLSDRGFTEKQIDRVQRPIGLDIGSKRPPEIALATLAGLVADRNGRDGGPYR